LRIGITFFDPGPGSGILSTLNLGYGNVKVECGIRDKHPGSATLCTVSLTFNESADQSRQPKNKFAWSKFLTIFNPEMDQKQYRYGFLHFYPL
jgi:hypothetical protein